MSRELKVKKVEANSDVAVGNPTRKTATEPSVAGTKGKDKSSTEAASSKKVLNEKMVEIKVSSNISTSKSKIAKNKSDNSQSKLQLTAKNKAKTVGFNLL